MYFGTERLGFIDGLLAADQNAPEGGGSLMEDQAGGAVFRGHAITLTVGIRLLAEGPDLDGVEAGLGGIRETHNLEAHVGDAGTDELDLAGGGVRQVDHATVDEGAAVRDTN